MTTKAADERELPPEPKPDVTFADHSYPAYSLKLLQEYTRAAVEQALAQSTARMEPVAWMTANGGLYSKAWRVTLECDGRDLSDDIPLYAAHIVNYDPTDLLLIARCTCDSRRK